MAFHKILYLHLILEGEKVNQSRLDAILADVTALCVKWFHFYAAFLPPLPTFSVCLFSSMFSFTVHPGSPPQCFLNIHIFIFLFYFCLFVLFVPFALLFPMHARAHGEAYIFVCWYMYICLSICKSLSICKNICIYVVG